MKMNLNNYVHLQSEINYSDNDKKEQYNSCTNTNIHAQVLLFTFFSCSH